jgi:hypothetical protein
VKRTGRSDEITAFETIGLGEFLIWVNVPPTRIGGRGDFFGPALSRRKFMNRGAFRSRKPALQSTIMPDAAESISRFGSSGVEIRAASP